VTAKRGIRGHLVVVAVDVRIYGPISATRKPFDVLAEELDLAKSQGDGI
jgi:hypothetical protein